ncbi:MAG: type III restriction endonuclease subunit R [Candidatus Bathyarchaeota archaeon]|nr:type III restriction endonuclease subunit R [Candidatus Termiticorpusculum sp.]
MLLYTVNFNEEELIQEAIQDLNDNLHIPKKYFKTEKGEQVETIESKKQLQEGKAFNKKDSDREDVVLFTPVRAGASVAYDLVGKVVAETELTRKAVVKILVGLKKEVFDQFGDDPEVFIIRAANIINGKKAKAIINQITYGKMPDAFGMEIFTEQNLKGSIDVNAMETERHLYDYVIYDSNTERDFATALEEHKKEVEIYVKLPRSFYINTPVGKYNPDWAIAFYENKVKHVYFVAETKGTESEMQLRDIEKAKADCARAHFHAISSDKVVYDIVTNYDRLWELAQ